MNTLGFGGIFIRHTEIVEYLLRYTDVYNEWIVSAPQHSFRTATQKEMCQPSADIHKFSYCPAGTQAKLPFESGWNPWQFGGLLWLNNEQIVDNTISCWQGSVNFANIEHTGYSEAIKRDIRRLVRKVRKEARVAHMQYDHSGYKRKVWISPGAQEFLDSGGRPSACHGPGPFRGDNAGPGRLIDYPGLPEMFPGTPFVGPLEPMRLPLGTIYYGDNPVVYVDKHGKVVEKS